MADIEKKTIQYSFPKIGELADLLVTNSRETAKECIRQGYTLLTVPQMFGMEDGEITLALLDQNWTVNQMSEANANRVLTDYEIASRDEYNA